MNNVVPNSADNTPGVYSINFVPVADVLAVPKAKANGYITDPVVLRTGAAWNEIYVTVDANNFDLNNGKSAEGNTNVVTVSGFVAGDAPWLVTTLQDMADYEEFLLIVTDADDQKRLVGSLEHPARFDYKLAYNGRRGYTLNFKCTSPSPPYYYRSPVVAYPDALLVSPSLMNLDAYIAQYMSAFDITKVNRAGDAEITAALAYKTEITLNGDTDLVYKKWILEYITTNISQSSEVTNAATIALLEDNANWTNNQYTGATAITGQDVGDFYINDSHDFKFRTGTTVRRIPYANL